MFPAPNHSHGYTKDFLIKFMKEHGVSFDGFRKWMDGQTISVDKGMTIYYADDVYRYLSRPPIID